MVAPEVYLIGKGKRPVCSVYLPPSDQETEKDIRDLGEQLLTPMILLEDFIEHNPLWENQKMSTKRRMMEKYLTDTTSCALTKKKLIPEHLTAAN